MATKLPLQLLLLLSILALTPTDSLAGDPIPWGYDKEDGPLRWSKIYKRWCSGRKQSPINLQSRLAVYDPYLEKYTISEPVYEGKEYRVLNDGHKVLVEFQNLPVNLSFNRQERECFRPHHVHWHWGEHNSNGSEHHLNGRQFPMEGHIVMWDCRFWDSFSEAAQGIDGLAVLGFFYEIDDSINVTGQSISEIVKLFDQPLVAMCDECTNKDYKNPGIAMPAFSIKQLLPQNMDDYFVYSGSLTTPDCRENVLWTVFRQPIKIPQSVIEKFRSLSLPLDKKTGKRYRMANNFRNPLELNPSVLTGARRQLSRSFSEVAGETKLKMK